MRMKLEPQIPLEFGPSHLKVTREFYEKYTAIDGILADAPEILNAFHGHLSKLLAQDTKGRRRRAVFTSDQILRAILVMEIEGLPYRETIIRIDDSLFLRRFVRLQNGTVMDYSLLCKAYKAVPPEAWKEINHRLAKHAITQGLITGTHLRTDTTACETNIHFPTDAALLWDSYRTLSRLITKVRRYAPDLVGAGRLQDRRVKRAMLLISRQGKQTEANRWRLQRPYRAMLARVSRIGDWCRTIRERLLERLAAGVYALEVASILMKLLRRMEHYDGLVKKVIDQATRRVVQGEQVPNVEKVFSIFEPHTELIIRGKAGKPMEFGHMVLLQQVKEKFITDYDTFERKPTDESLVDGILASHRTLFGALPESFSADKGFYTSMDKLRELESSIAHVSIAKKGSRTEAEREREHHPIFRTLQRFRAGIEGTISALKRSFKMHRCLYRSFRTYCSSIGSHVFAHNLVVLARL